MIYDVVSFLGLGFAGRSCLNFLASGLDHHLSPHAGNASGSAD